MNGVRLECRPCSWKSNKRQTESTLQTKTWRCRRCESNKFLSSFWLIISFFSFISWKTLTNVEIHEAIDAFVSPLGFAETLKSGSDWGTSLLTNPSSACVTLWFFAGSSFASLQKGMSLWIKLFFFHDEFTSFFASSSAILWETNVDILVS